MKLLYHTVITAAMFLALTTNASGQALALQDHEFITNTNPWLTSGNAAGLSTLPTQHSTFVEAFAAKQNGGLHGLTESDNSFDAGIQTESYIKVSDRIHLYGNLSYGYFKGQKMGGPVLMDPSYNPVNFYEDNTETLGTKTKESYHLIGGIAYTINDIWSVGAKIDYESADQTKIKDPRFLNVWMDMGVTAGVRFAPSDAFSIGLNLDYQRTLEQIDGDRVGVTDQKYFTFIDLGGFYGSRELFDGDHGYVPVTEVRPMFNALYGGSLQIEAGRDTKFFSEVSFLSRSGYYGKRSSTTIVYTEHSSNIIGYRGVLITGKGDNRHRIGLDFRYEGLTNGENIYRMNSEVGQYTVVEYFGQNEVLKRTDISGALSYTGYLGVKDYRPSWEYGIVAEGAMRNSTTTIYPYYRSSSITTAAARMFGKRNMMVQKKHMLTAGIEGCFSMGFGNPKSDGALAGSTSNAPKSADSYMNRDFEYKTGMQAGGRLSLRYTHICNEKVAVYTEARESYTHLLKKPEFLNGNNRNIIELSIGCTF